MECFEQSINNVGYLVLTHLYFSFSITIFLCSTINIFVKVNRNLEAAIAFVERVDGYMIEIEKEIKTF